MDNQHKLHSPKTFELRPYKLKELAHLYNVSRDTFRKHLTPFKTKVGHRRGHYYSVSQVKVIINHLGRPGIVNFDQI